MGVRGPGHRSAVMVWGWGPGQGGFMPLGKNLNTRSDGFSAHQNSDHFAQIVGNPSQTLSTLTQTDVLLED